MDLSIIIVNWNSKEYLLKCIASILATTRSLEFEVVVVDSGSFDGCEGMLRQYYPQVRFIQSDKNQGFARANNSAFKGSSGLNLLFLNPDTEVVSNAIVTLHHQLMSLPSAGVVGAKLLNSDGSVQTSCIQAFPTILNQLVDFNALRNLFPQASLWGMKPLFAGKGIPAEVDTVSGACLMVKRAVFEKLEMFSTDYFMYSEDIDFCFKVHEAGWKTYYVPSAVVVHHGGASSIQSSISTFTSVMMVESRWRFFQKTRSLGYCWLYRFAILYVSAIRIGLVLLAWPIGGMRGTRSQLKTVLKKWIARLRWTIGAENWVKNY